MMWIVCGSGSYAVAAPISETRVGELVCGLLRCIRANGNALASALPFFLSWFEYSTRLVTPQHQVRC